MGQTVGAETHTLNPNTLPSHTHQTVVNTSAQAADDAQGGGRHLAVPAVDIYSATAGGQPLAGVVTGNTGGNQPVNHMPPVLAIHFIIALQGVFPARG